MQELIEAAKAVIDATETGDRWCAIANLSAAVEQAEADKVDREDALFAACMYGAKTEREKWVRAVKRMEEEHSYKYLDELLEMIDAPT